MFDYPAYYDIGYRWRSVEECDVLEAAFARYAQRPVRRLLDIGCGSGRHLLELARRGYQGVGCDRSEAMVRFVQQQTAVASLPVYVFCGDLRRLGIGGSFDAAICLMDTFRYVVTDAELRDHIAVVARCLLPGGLYVLDCWMPRQEHRVGAEAYDWEQRADGVTVRVLYRQYSASLDWARRTFEDELVFEVNDHGRTLRIEGGRATTRFFLVPEWTAFCRSLAAFELVAQCDDFDLDAPYRAPAASWRMVTVLRRR